MVIVVSMIVAIFVIMLALSTGQCMTDYDYRYSKAPSGVVEPTTVDSLHGSSSAYFCVRNDGRSKSISLIPFEPFALHEIGRFDLGVMPLSGAAELEIEIHLDGNNDGKYSSSRPEDARLIVSAARWDMTRKPALREWTELNLMEMTGRTLSKDPALVGKGLSWSGLLDRVGQLEVVKIYLRLRGANSSCLVDRVRMGEEVVSFEAMEREAIKRSKQRTYGAGSTMTYYIVYANNREDPGDVTVTEHYPAGAGLVEADPSPDPGTNNRWTFRDLPPGQHGRITVKLRMSKGYAEVDGDGQVSGTGMVSVRRSLTTRKDSHLVKNQVTVSGGGINRTASAPARIRSIPGHTLLMKESGTGDYRSEEELHYLGTSIRASRSFVARSSPIVLNLTRRRIDLSSPWSSETYAGNDRMSDEFLQRHHYCPRLNLSSRAELRSSKSMLEIQSNMSGLAFSRTSAEGRMLGFFGIGDLNISTRAEARKSSKKGRKPPLDLGCLCQR